jgi:protein gp37
MSLTKTAIPYLTRVFGAARGCSMGCPYCSTARWSHRLACPDCRARKVHFHEERLGDPAEAKKPQIVGVSFYDELFDPERPVADVCKVFGACEGSPQHQYVFLTKQAAWPSGMTIEMFSANANWWLGVSVTGNMDVDHERLARMEAWTALGVRTWLSLEPWFGPEPLLLRQTIKGVGFVAIGCESGRTVDAAYDESWQRSAAAIVAACRDAGVPVFVKQAWVGGRCSRDQGEWPLDLRVREVPADWRNILWSPTEGRSRMEGLA